MAASQLASGPDYEHRSPSPVQIGIGLVLIYEYRLKDLGDIAPFLSACNVLAHSLGAKADHLEVCWLYGKDPTKPNTIRCFAGFWSLSAQLEFIKSKEDENSDKLIQRAA